MICNSCGAVLPDESHFCPYCMTRFGEESKESKNRNTKRIVIATALLVVILAVVAAVITVFKKNNGNYNDAEKANGIVQQSKSSASSTEKEKVTAEIDGRYYEPGTYFYNIDGEGEIVLETFDYYPF